jgi:hypothetical protein
MNTCANSARSDPLEKKEYGGEEKMLLTMLARSK